MVGKSAFGDSLVSDGNDTSGVPLIRIRDTSPTHWRIWTQAISAELCRIYPIELRAVRTAPTRASGLRALESKSRSKRHPFVLNPAKDFSARPAQRSSRARLHVFEAMPRGGFNLASPPPEDLDIALEVQKFLGTF